MGLNRNLGNLTEVIKENAGKIGIGNSTPAEILDVTGNVKAASFIKTGGTSSEYLMANGSVSTGPDLSGYVPTSRQLTINGTAYNLSADRSWSVGTVTSVSALTLGTTGTDLSSTVSNGTTTPVITLNVPTASATNRGALSSADWTTFNNKQSALTFTAPLVNTSGTVSIAQATTSTNGYLSSTDWNTFNGKQGALTLTTTGTSGASTLVGNTLNIPQYQSVITNPVTGTGTTNYISKFTGSSAIGNSAIYDNSGNIGIGTITPGTAPNNTILGFVNGSNIQARAAVPQIAISANIDGDWYAPTYKTSNYASQVYVDGNGGTIALRIAASGTAGNAITWNTPAIYIANNSNVLINTTTDAGYKLDVNGTGRFSGNLTLSTSDSRIKAGDSVGRGIYSNSDITSYITMWGSSHATYPNNIDIIAGAGTSNGNIIFNTTSTERMRITSGGNVQLDNGELNAPKNFNFQANRTTLGNLGSITWKNIQWDGYIRAAIQGVADTALSNGALVFSTGATNSDAVERMRITSGGNVLIGTTTDSGYKLTVKGTAGIGQFTNGTAAIDAYGAIAYYGCNTATNGIRINSSGDLLVGKTGGWTENGFQTEAGATTVGITNNSTANNIFLRKNGASGNVIAFYYDGTGVGSIAITSSTTGYYTSSDYRLKQDLKSFNGLDLVSKIKVYDYEWKSDETRSYGVIAHELQEVIPQAVTGNKDEEKMQSVDYSKLVPILVASIQELKAEIELLKSKL